ncbi:hypothetical protein CLV92_113109 [Kineococcus xinjiangensis]|uniref:Uncharacterized protein n=1 Tax=Kineococcus xinjiangensis TaxID=512762 RepID=A0A2S6IEU5_9ACTN|nr:hypothetical protein CLV92_113109 [Kineococcus xinjiangensis]
MIRRLSHRLHVDLVRSPKGVQHLTTLVVTAVSTILLTRLFLELTGYPQIGGSSLHIAHVLPGGLLMLAALVLLLAHIGAGPRPPAAVLGGVGFGLFIDEVGKFVTTDNDYFYEPAAAIMYVVFALLVTWATRWRRSRPLDPDERVAGAAFALVDGLAGRLSERRRDDALRLLEKAGDSPGAAEIGRLLRQVRPAPVSPSHHLEDLWVAVRSLFDRLAGTRWAVPLMGALLLAQALGATLIAVGLWRAGEGDGVSFSGVLLGATASFFLALAGLRRWRDEGRRAAVESFQRAVLVSLLLTQVFLFAASQFTATAGLLVDLVLLGLLTADLDRLRRTGEEPAQS